MYTSDGLKEFHKRSHQTLKTLLQHCNQLSDEELNKELSGFGYPTVRIQIHHIIGAEKYWIGVLLGRIDVDMDENDYQTVDSLEIFREQVYDIAEDYLRSATTEELSTARPMITWGNKEKMLIPAQVIMRTLTHLYHHTGQIAAMCRHLGKPIPEGNDYPIT